MSGVRLLALLLPWAGDFTWLTLCFLISAMGGLLIVVPQGCLHILAEHILDYAHSLDGSQRDDARQGPGTPPIISLVTLASSWLEPQLSPSFRLPLLGPKGKGTLRGPHPAPPLLSVPVGSWRDCVLLPNKTGFVWPGVTCHATREQGMSAMRGE